ncbi:glutamine amidotransferase [Lentilactobacillus parafarraginis]|uniref:Glutamine amidotransferase n=1 Tax=Lentilactobacillus parafarraginis TaxID=390842 RepID=A0A5R9CSS3_9LACO|nr:DJ-1/PfpI family protein [Lentilactobacillus parafarraginis]TLQ17960.1 glutamine amidotransferase [Lentilactobacillus parafarraginis]
MKQAVFVMMQQFSDWEGAYLTSQLNAADNWQVKTASDNQYVKSIGGLNVRVDYLLEDIPDDINLLVLIGGNSWNLNSKRLKTTISKTLNDPDKTVAAICGAVDYLARNGLLNKYRHTGNAVYLWKDYSEYTNQKCFERKQSVVDQNLITANGTAPLEFTERVLNNIHFDTPTSIHKSVNLYRIGYYQYISRYGDPFGNSHD